MIEFVLKTYNLNRILDNQQTCNWCFIWKFTANFISVFQAFSDETTNIVNSRSFLSVNDVFTSFFSRGFQYVIVIGIPIWGLFSIFQWYFGMISLFIHNACIWYKKYVVCMHGTFKNYTTWHFMESMTPTKHQILIISDTFRSTILARGCYAANSMVSSNWIVHKWLMFVWQPLQHVSIIFL